jgi:hypothetical protein
MAVTPEDLAAGTLALQVFIKNSQYVEVIVQVAFGAIPSILGIGAAGLIGSGVINTARDVMHSISLIKTLGHAAPVYGKAISWAGTKIWRNVRGGKNKDTTEKEGQGTQDKQEGQGGGVDNTPVVPPNIKPSDKKEENNKTENAPIHPSYGLPNPFKRKK